jgi:hypothetical protein
MGTQPRSPSPRWHTPEHDTIGGFWKATLRTLREADTLSRVAYGPTRDACIRETVRLDREWGSKQAAPAPSTTEAK